MTDTGEVVPVGSDPVCVETVGSALTVESSSGVSSLLEFRL